MWCPKRTFCTQAEDPEGTVVVHGVTGELLDGPEYTTPAITLLTNERNSFPQASVCEDVVGTTGGTPSCDVRANRSCGCIDIHADPELQLRFEAADKLLCCFEDFNKSEPQ